MQISINNAQRINVKMGDNKSDSNNARKIRYGIDRDIVSFSGNYNPSGDKKGIITTGLGLLLEGFKFIITGGQSRKDRILNSIPEDFRSLFAQIKGKTGNDFVDTAYLGLVKFMHLEDIAPNKIINIGPDGLVGIYGGYNFPNNSLGFSEGFFTKIKPQKQINFLAQELKHCEQYSNMLRTEGVTPEDMARILAENGIENALRKPFNFMFKFRYKSALEEGKEKEFIQNAIDGVTTETAKQIRKNQKNVLAMPKISQASKEGQKALEQLKLLKDYEGIDTFVGYGSEKYKTHSIETEAYEFGDKIEKMFQDFISIS